MGWKPRRDGDQITQKIPAPQVDLACIRQTKCSRSKNRLSETQRPSNFNAMDSGVTTQHDPDSRRVN
jgi:hypothetical protein